MRFAERVAIVTGGAHGIGAATAERLAAEGARVVIADRDADAAQQVASRLGTQSVGRDCDVTRRDSVDELVDDCLTRFERLDVVVACAGITRDNLLFRMTDDDWDAVIDTHLKGTFNVARAAQAAMVERRYGRMCFLSSASARGNRGQANYSAAKAGLQGLARTLAIELGPFGVTVNTVAPGFIETRMTEQTAERMGVDYDELKRQAAERLPLGRVGTPEDIAGVVAFLCSDDAAFVTGQTLYARGGP